jgi:HEAT repeat protein
MRPVAPDPVGSEILSQLRSKDPYDQYFAVMSICDLERTELLPAVVPLLESHCTDLRYVAIQTIGDHGKSNRCYYGPLLLPFLVSPDAETRQYAAEALAAIDYQDSIPDIERMLEDEIDDETRQFTERALRFLKRENTPEDDLPVFRLTSVDLSRRAVPESAFAATVH